MPGKARAGKKPFGRQESLRREGFDIGTMWNSESDVIKEGFRIKGLGLKKGL